MHIAFLFNHMQHVFISIYESGLLQFSEEKVRILKSVKSKQQDVSPEVLVTAIDVKCNFT